MNIKIITVIIFFLASICKAKTKCTLDGFVKNFDGALSCIIYNYRDGNEYKLIKIENTKGTILHSFDDVIEDGIFRLVLLDSKNSRTFDFIISNNETVIKFYYDFSNEDSLPIFLESKCNQDWYSFINYDVNNKRDIKELEDYQKLNFTSNKNISLENSQKAIQNLKNEYLKIKKEFTMNSGCLLAVLMVNCKNYNTLNFNTETESYINEEALLLECENKKNEILNTPILKDYIHFKVIKATLNSTSLAERIEKIKRAYCNIIDKLSENKLVKKCAIRYAILGFREMNDEETVNYFVKKYNYIM